MAFLQRHECVVCPTRSENLLRRGDSPAPEHCGQPMRRLIGAPAGRVAGSPFVGGQRAPAHHPHRQLIGRHLGEHSDVVGGSSSAPVLTGAAGQAGRLPRGESQGPEIQHRQWPKPFEACSASERDERWRDTTESMAQWQADCLEQSGMQRGAALRKASADQQQITEKARAAYEHPTGVN